MIPASILMMLMALFSSLSVEVDPIPDDNPSEDTIADTKRPDFDPISL